MLAASLLVYFRRGFPFGVHGTSACDCCSICWRNVASEYRYVLCTLQKSACLSCFARRKARGLNITSLRNAVAVTAIVVLAVSLTQMCRMFLCAWRPTSQLRGAVKADCVSVQWSRAGLWSRHRPRQLSLCTPSCTTLWVSKDCCSERQVRSRPGRGLPPQPKGCACQRRHESPH